MTTDGFGIEHPDHCQRPLWRTTRARNGGDHYQHCKNCGITWRQSAADKTRHKALRRFGIPPELLPGNTQEEVEEQAVNLLAFTLTPTITD